MKKYLLIFAILLTPLTSQAASSPFAIEPIITSYYVSPLSPDFAQPYAGFRFSGGKFSFKTGTLKLGLAVPVPIANLTNSLRFRSSASAYLSRTFGSQANRYIFTVSFWVKMGKLSTYTTPQMIFSATGNDRISFNGSGNDVLDFSTSSGGTYAYTTAVLRDVSAWYHIVYAIDLTQAIDVNRVKLYVNNKQLTLAGTLPAQNALIGFNTAVAHRWGYDITNNYAWDGYLSDAYFIDGQALTPSRFGQYDANGVWVPRAYPGTYGTNGFHMDFKDAAQTVASNVGLGKDVSGNANYWVTNGISTTAGVTYDSMVDTPTNNYTTLNSLDKSGTITNGNLTGTGSGWQGARSSNPVPTTGKWYFEAELLNTSGNTNAQLDLGFQLATTTLGNAGSGFYGLEVNNGFFIYTNSSASSNRGGTTSAGSILQVAVDADSGKAWLGVNNSWYDTYNTTNGNPSAGTNQTFSSLTFSNGYFPVYKADGNTIDANFGQRPFTYTPPSGFLALSTANLPAVTIPNPKKYFDAKTRTGTGATFNVAGGLFSPDLVWIKGRSAATDHAIYDAMRGVQKRLESNNTDAEVTGDSTGLTAFNAGGFTGGALAQINTNTATYVDWMWKAGGAGVSNTDGSITSTVSANQTAGFSIVTYTGTGANATVGHGLGSVPKMMIIKPRGAADWYVWNTGLGGSTDTDYLIMNNTGAKGQYGSLTTWNGTAPNSTVISLGTASGVNAITPFVAYAFAEVAGFSKFGSYVGNGVADGPFVYTGFRPKWILLKLATGAGGYWEIVDTARCPYNACTVYLSPNATDTDGAELIDILSNGFKLRYTPAYSTNSDGGTIIYAAFAEMPSGGSNVSPAPAR